MPNLSRRDLLRASAGAAVVAVPMVALASPASAEADDADSIDLQLANAPSGPVMFCIHDASKGEVTILHGTSEVIVQDRRLVARIMSAAQVRQDR